MNLRPDKIRELNNNDNPENVCFEIQIDTQESKELNMKHFLIEQK